METNLESKYYTPDIEDLHVGYVAEVEMEIHGEYETSEPPLREWTHWTFKSVRPDYPITHTRTKCLDKEDIESLGWTYRPDSFLVQRAIEKGIEYKPTHFWFTFKGFGLTYPFKGEHTIQITDDRVHHFSPIVTYQGECKSINELKTLMKMLNI